MSAIDFAQHIRATPTQIWRALTDEHELKTWLKLSEAQMSTHPGDRFSWRWKFGVRESYGYGGVILAADDGKYLELQWEMPECDAVTTVHIRLKAAFYGLERDYGGTDLHLIHAGIPQNKRGLFEWDGHNRHWRQGMGELAAYVEGRPGKPRPGAIAGLLYIGGAPGQGLLVRDVIIGSGAQEAGIRAGDRIMAVDDRTMNSLDDFHEWIDYCSPGDIGTFILQDRTTQVVLRPPEQMAELISAIQRKEDGDGHDNLAPHDRCLAETPPAAGQKTPYPREHVLDVMQLRPRVH